jgi:hypothetical protein
VCISSMLSILELCYVLTLLYRVYTFVMFLYFKNLDNYNVIFTSIRSTSKSKSIATDKINLIKFNLENRRKNVTKVNSIYVGINFHY